MQVLRRFLRAEITAGRGFFPPAPLVFNALRLTPVDDVRVVILGQDPYHGPGEAMGLSLFGKSRQASRNRRRSETSSPSLERDLDLQASGDGAISPPGPSTACSSSTPCSPSALRSPGIARGEGLGKDSPSCVTIAELRRAATESCFSSGSGTPSRRGRSSMPTRHHVLTAAHPSPYSGEQRLLRLSPLLPCQRTAQGVRQPPGRAPA